MDAHEIFAIERPHPKLWKLYVIRAIMTLPAFPLTFLLLYFRYHTMRYRFDDEGVHMKVGILFRSEVNLTYARIQDIHLTSGPIQRWLGLADIQIQTASGKGGAEMTIEGMPHFEAIRDFLYSKMRGGKRPATASPPATGEATPVSAEAVELLGEIRDALRGARQALEARRNA